MTPHNPTIHAQTPSSFPPGSTPFPNYLTDEEMPHLSDTAWRIVCVLVRQTLGRKGDAGRRKERDWLTHSQLKVRTGRESAAVCRAIQSLLDKRLIVVEDSDGKALLTTQQRQFKMGRLYFRLHSRVLSGDKERRNPAEAFSVVKKPNAESENTKAKTTKETVYKNTPPSPSTRPNEAIQEFWNYYRKLFQQRSPKALSPPFSENREDKLIRELLEQYPLQTLCELLELFFAAEDRWAREQGYSLIAFRHRLPKLLMQPSQTTPTLTTRGTNWAKANTLLPGGKTEINPKGGA